MKANAKGKAFEVYDRLKKEGNGVVPDLVIGCLSFHAIMLRLRYSCGAEWEDIGKAKVL